MTPYNWYSFFWDAGSCVGLAYFGFKFILDLCVSANVIPSTWKNQTSYMLIGDFMIHSMKDGYFRFIQMLLVAITVILAYWMVPKGSFSYVFFHDMWALHFGLLCLLHINSRITYLAIKKRGGFGFITIPGARMI